MIKYNGVEIESKSPAVIVLLGWCWDPAGWRVKVTRIMEQPGPDSTLSGRGFYFLFGPLLLRVETGRV